MQNNHDFPGGRLAPSGGMKTHVFTVNLKDDPEVIRRYEAYHDAIFPEVTASLRATSILDLRIWRLGRRLVMVMDVRDDYDPVEASRIHRASHPRVLEWEVLMDGFQERVPEATGASTWAEMKQIFALPA